MNKIKELHGDVEYLIEKRDDAIEHFSEKLKNSMYSEDELRRSFETVLRTCKITKLAEDAMIVYIIEYQKQNYENTFYLPSKRRNRRTTS